MADPEYSFAFQPIVDVAAGRITSYEALIRGVADQSAWSVLGQVPAAELHRFDAAARGVAVDLAGALGLDCQLNLNFLPQSLLGDTDPLAATLAAATRAGLPLDRLVLEMTETEAVADHARFAARLDDYRRAGLKIAIDDFGSGYSGLNLLADFQPDQIKLDMQLIRGIERHGPRQAIVRAVNQVCGDLGIDVLAEGVETMAEYAWLAHEGVRLFQGYLFSRPGFRALPAAAFPALPGTMLSLR